MVCLVVCLTVLFVVVFAKCVGCSLPLLAEKVGLDPAVMASPFIFPCTALSLIFFLLSKSKRLQRTSAFSIAIYTRICSV